jgi:hypothetical protein
MTERLLAPLSTLHECAKRLRAVAKDEFGLTVSRDDVLKALLSSHNVSTEAQYKQKLDIQGLERVQPACNGMNPIEEITHLMRDALRKALAVESPTSMVLMEYIHRFSQRKTTFNFFWEMDNSGLTAALNAVMIGLADQRLMEVAKTVNQHAYEFDEEDLSASEYWGKAVNYAVLSFEMSLNMALSRKRQTKQLLEFYSEHAVTDLVRSRQYHAAIEYAVANLDWFCGP